MTLNFSSSGGVFVSDPITIGDSQYVGYQLTFAKKSGVEVTLEVLVDSDSKWDTPETAGAVKVSRKKTFTDTVAGPSGMKVRIKTDYKPETATYSL